MHTPSRFHPWLMLVLLVTGVLPGLRTSPVQAQATPIAEQAHYTPLLPEVASPPHWFRGTDDQVHLVYELLLTNAFPVPVDLTVLDVVNADTGESVATLGGEDLLAATSLLIDPTSPATAVPAGSVAVVWVDARFADAEQLPPTITHRLTVQVPPGLPVPEIITQEGGEAEVDLRPPIVLSPPLAGARWVAVGSCCDGPHRRALQPIDGHLRLAQRFAIDFNRLDADARTSVGDPTRNESAPGYGQPVLAVADAVVAMAIDRYPDQVPNAQTEPTLESAEGNRIVLDLGDGRYALYAHLKPGSITVQEGERVEAGHVMAGLGNSGNSTGAHLHFHVMDGPSGLASDGLPYVFDGFTLTGTVPPLAELLVLDATQEPVPVDPAGAGPRADELPLGRDVVTFPDIAAGG